LGERAGVHVEEGQRLSFEEEVKFGRVVFQKWRW
jgi:hypothetical protein